METPEERLARALSNKLGTEVKVEDGSASAADAQARARRSRPPPARADRGQAGTWLAERALPRFFDVPEQRQRVLERLRCELYAAELTTTSGE